MNDPTLWSFFQNMFCPLTDFALVIAILWCKWFFHTGTWDENKWWFDNIDIKCSRHKWIKKEKIIHKTKETFTQITTRNRVLQLIAIPLLQYGLHYDSNMVVMQIIIFDQIFLLVYFDLSFDFCMHMLSRNTYWYHKFSSNWIQVVWQKQDMYLNAWRSCNEASISIIFQNISFPTQVEGRMLILDH